MLFDPRHDNTLTMASLALFCASKPENEAYHWPDCRKCAVGQWLQSHGHDPASFKWIGEIQTMNDLARGGHLGMYYDPKECTFGKLADRILQYQRSFDIGRLRYSRDSEPLDKCTGKV